VEEDLQVRSREPKMASKKTFFSTIGRFESRFPTVRRFTKWVNGRGWWEATGTGG